MKKNQNILIKTLLGLLCVNSGITGGGLFGELVASLGVLVIIYELAIYSKTR